MKEDLLEIFDFFGYEEQRNKLCEEFRELQDELYEIYVKGGDNDNLLNEGVDNISIILQFLFNYGYEFVEIVSVFETRLKRTVERKRNGYYGEGRNGNQSKNNEF